MKIKDISTFYVNRGPGSFAGIRNSLSTVKAIHLAKKIPILAIGSNRSPSQLLRKFGKNETVAVTDVIVKNFDVIYASLISYYGAVPATLWPVKGSEVKLSIIWLSNSQLEKMHETEAVGKAYDFVEFDYQLLNFKSFS